ncbi:MAG: prepilin-type N-terminal cleavage/methylation domain-containing protein [Magnetococcales bacterium]|nr:prepilin-type N-terminal cleavage/methylation domain-containing protein [Magnetococcales bacterium]
MVKIGHIQSSPSRPAQPIVSESGFSLIELSIVLIIIGIIMSTVAQLYPNLIMSNFSKQNATRMTQAYNAIIGYMSANHKLPCPSTSATSGDQDVSGVGGVCGAAVGYLPYNVLGLNFTADVYQNAIVYGVYNNSAAGDNVPDLTGISATNSNRSDICNDLANASDATAVDTLLHVVDDTSNALDQNIPFVVMSRGFNTSYDTPHAAPPALIFSKSTRTINVDSYDDLAYSPSFTQLSGRLRCGQNRDPLRIVNTSIHSGEAGVEYKATFYADGLRGTNFQWCVKSTEVTVGFSPANVSTDCSVAGNYSASGTANLTLDLTTSQTGSLGGGTKMFEVFLKDVASSDTVNRTYTLVLAPYVAP